MSTGRARWLYSISMLLLVLSFTITSARSTSAQQPSLTVKIDGFSADDWSNMHVIVSVLDGSDKPVAGLTTEDFGAEVNGSKVPTTGLATGVDSDLPVSVVLAFDASGGMAFGGLDQAKAAAHRFVGALGPQDEVAILAYGDAVSLAQTFTTDRALANASIDGIAAGGAASLYQGTTQSILLASASSDTGRRAVVLVSSAADNGAAGSRDQSLVAAKALGVPVFVIGLGENIDRDYLQAIADAGGGQLTQAVAPGALGQLYQDVSDLLRNQYVLSLDGAGLNLQSSDPADLNVSATLGDNSGSDHRFVCPERLCVALSGINAGDSIGKPVRVTANVVSADPITSVTFLIDGTASAPITAEPYEITLDPAQLSGKHTVAAEVITAGNTTRSSVLQVRLGGGAAGGNTMMYAIVGVAIVAVLLAGYFIMRRRGGGHSSQPTSPSDKPKIGPLGRPRPKLSVLDRENEPAAAPATAVKALGRLHVTGGPLSGQSFAIGDAPVSIGSGHRCAIRIPLDEGVQVAPEFARVWIRDTHLMVHELRQLTASGPIGGRWEMLEDGDVFIVGPCTLRFELDGAAARPAKAGAAAEPPPSVLRKQETFTIDSAPPVAAPPVAAPAVEPAPAIEQPAPATPAPAPEPAPVDIFRKPSSEEKPVEPPVDIFRSPEQKQASEKPVETFRTPASPDAPIDIFKSKPKPEDAGRDDPPRAASGP